MVANLMLVTVGVYVLQLLVDGTGQGPAPLTDFLVLKSQVFSSELLTHPWWLLNFLTYGFTHSRTDFLHIGFNMLGLWVFGRDIEARYGRREFLAIYLSAIIISGAVWAGVEVGREHLRNFPTVMGASGAVMAVLAIFVLNFPNRTILINFFIPVPAWVLALLYLLGDLRGAFSRNDMGNVAYVAHFGGLIFGVLYFKTGWTLARLLPRKFSLKRLKPGPKLRVHSPDDAEMEEAALSRQVDEILQKIQEKGQESLTAKERRILERASRRYQQKHR